MFKTEIKTVDASYTRSCGYAVCDRCGHVMDETDHHSGYNNLAILRFGPARGSKFGDGLLSPTGN